MELKPPVAVDPPKPPPPPAPVTPAPVSSPGSRPAAAEVPQQAGPAGARLTLRREGALTAETFVLGEGRLIVGRFDSETGPVDIDLGTLPEAVYISRQHAEIWRSESGQWFVKDRGSGNGTFVCLAGQRQFQKAGEPHALKDGDEIAFGNARFEFRVG